MRGETSVGDLFNKRISTCDLNNDSWSNNRKKAERAERYPLTVPKVNLFGRETKQTTVCQLPCHKGGQSGFAASNRRFVPITVFVECRLADEITSTTSGGMLKVSHCCSISRHEDGD